MTTVQLSARSDPLPGVPPAADLVAGGDAASARMAPAAQGALGVLVAAAGCLAMDDRTAAARLREAARRVTGQLAALGRLPAHLVVAPDEPDVVVVRTLAAAWRLAGSSTTDDADGADGASAGAGGRCPESTAGESFDELYDRLVAAWHARLTASRTGGQLAQRVEAEERYRTARQAIRAWLEQEGDLPWS